MKSPRTLQEAVSGILLDSNKILFYKRRLRGTGNIQQQGMAGILDRMLLDKGARLRNAVELEKGIAWLKSLGVNPELIPQLNLQIKAQGGGESVRDDLLDIINYSIIAILVMDNQWELPLSEEEEEDSTSNQTPQE